VEYWRPEGVVQRESPGVSWLRFQPPACLQRWCLRQSGRVGTWMFLPVLTMCNCEESRVLPSCGS
jgi:hypothetical protein